MTVVVTGATGRLGRLVVEQLLARGIEPGIITATGRDRARLGELAALGVVAVASDYDDRASLDAVFRGAATVLFVSGSEVGRRVPQHTNVVEAARAAGVGWVVYTSIAHADTSPLGLAAEHRFTEQLLLASGMATTILRNNWYTENFVQLVGQADRQHEILTGWHDGRIASASRTDYAEGAAAVLTTSGYEGAVLELSGDVAWSGDDLAQAASTILGHPVVHTRRTMDEQRIDLTQAGLSPEQADAMIAMDTGIRQGALADATPTLRGLLGRPTTPLLVGLREAVEAEAAGR